MPPRWPWTGMPMTPAARPVSSASRNSRSVPPPRPWSASRARAPTSLWPSLSALWVWVPGCWPRGAAGIRALAGDRGSGRRGPDVLEPVDAGQVREDAAPADGDHDGDDPAAHDGRHGAHEEGRQPRLERAELVGGADEHHLDRRYPAAQPVRRGQRHGGGPDAHAEQVDEAAHAEGEQGQ